MAFLPPNPARVLLRVASLLALAVLPRSALPHPDRVEDRLLSHFATGSHPIQDHSWSDVSGRQKVRLHGEPRIANLGPAQGLILDGFTDWIEIATNREAATALLPKREMSVAAWVLVDETQPDGGIAGFVQDNGNYEKGWVLGFNRRAFTFSLASVSTDDGDGLLTKVAAKSPIETGRWHYVVATYDGNQMRLYVDGKEEGSSTAQSGDILYPEQGRYALGGFIDDNEKHLLQGALQEVKIYARVMDPAEINAVAQRNAP
ncbi:MAG: LamG domain-containing protein, partial [Nitrospira sp.]|nr:LamG domain-containing protein [Nitrospira sp.]